MIISEAVPPPPPLNLLPEFALTFDPVSHSMSSGVSHKASHPLDPLRVQTRLALTVFPPSSLILLIFIPHIGNLSEARVRLVLLISYQDVWGMKIRVFKKIFCVCVLEGKFLKTFQAEYDILKMVLKPPTNQNRIWYEVFQ